MQKRKWKVAKVVSICEKWQLNLLFPFYHSRHFEIFFLFIKKISIDKLSQSLFSRKNKNIIKLSSAKLSAVLV